MRRVALSRLVIATHNRKKGGEMATILGSRFPSLSLLTLADFPGAPEPEETGTTYEENAVIKSSSAFEFTGEWCVADDAGLEIDALEGAPGVYSKRFGGEDLPFPEKMARILSLLRDVPEERRGARFRCYVALTGEFPISDGRLSIEPDSGRTADPTVMPENRESTRVFSAVCEGRIALAPSGAGGFGYDPIFYLPELGCTMADLTPEQKHAVSHRGKVLRLLGDYLATL